MHYVALATDYDGTIAHDGMVDPPTLDALQRLRMSGRKLILVTGRELDDLRRVTPDLDVFDWIVAENGALLYSPATREERLLAPAPPAAFVAALEDAGVSPLSVGRAIVATWELNEGKVLAAIHALGLDLQITFNKGAVMVLPGGVSKESGLRAALAMLEISPRNVVAVGDAENDFAFFTLCGMPVAVQNALTVLKQAAMLVTEGARGAGVAELIGRMIATDLAEFDPANPRQSVTLAEAMEPGAEPLSYLPARGALLVAGSSGGGKTTLTTGLLERLGAAGFQALVIDPEGDYDDFEGCICLGTAQDAPAVDTVVDVLCKTGTGVSVNLVGVKLDDRPAFLAALMPELVALRARTGRPHLIVVDEAHHLLPGDPGGAPDPLPRALDGMMFVTVRPEALAARVATGVERVLAVGAEAGQAIEIFCRMAGWPAPARTEPPLLEPVPTGELLTLSRANGLRRMRMIPGCSTLQRHVRKYAEGNLEDDQAFFFRGPHAALNLRAGNLTLFLQMADGVDEATWAFHRDAGDYSRWIGLSIKDRELAEEVAAVERGGLAFPADRDAIRAMIERRYTSPA